MLVSALLEDVAMLHNLHAILSVPGIGRQRARLAEFQATLVSGGVEPARSADDGIRYMRLRRRIAPSPRRAVLKRTIEAGSGAGTASPVKSNVVCWAMFQSVS